MVHGFYQWKTPVVTHRHGIYLFTYVNGDIYICLAKVCNKSSLFCPVYSAPRRVSMQHRAVFFLAMIV